MEKEKVSVIIPCYNVEEYIERCVESIVVQDYGFDNIELILVDDCSTDGTAGRLEAIERKYPDSVLLIKTEENRGPGSSRNTGMLYASGAYIAFVDGDDIVAPSMISELMDMSLRYDCDVAECSYGIFDDPVQTEYRQTGEERFFLLDNENIRKIFIVNSLKSAV